MIIDFYTKLLLKNKVIRLVMVLLLIEKYSQIL